MKKYHLPILLFVILLLLLATLIIQVRIPPTPPPREFRTRSPRPPWRPRRLFRQKREPEFRGPPYHNYKPPEFQQMGVLTGGAGEILPLYGKASNAYRDRYNYYTTTPGQQIYPLPVSHDNRDCTEDMGCNELYGNETVNITGMTGPFNVNSYRTKTFT